MKLFMPIKTLLEIKWCTNGVQSLPSVKKINCTAFLLKHFNLFLFKHCIFGNVLMKLNVKKIDPVPPVPSHVIY